MAAAPRMALPRLAARAARESAPLSVVGLKLPLPLPPMLLLLLLLLPSLFAE